MRVSAIIAAGGTGRRVGAAVPKQLLELDGRSILERSVAAFDGHAGVAETVVVLPRDLADAPPDWLRTRARVKVVSGGDRRQDSVANGFDAIDARADVILVHDAARPFVSADVITRVIDAAAAHGAAIAAIAASDTVKRVEADGDGGRVVVDTIPREAIFLAQTPQGFSRRVLGDAVALGRAGVEATDEAMLAERAGHRVRIVEGAAANVKITTAADIDAAARRMAAGSGRIGVGYDLHRLVPGRRLIVGGVDVPSEVGASGHSDADVVCHAVTDALLGAASAGDIGAHFPDTDPRWKDASSIELLRQMAALVRSRGLHIVNVDIVIVLERPKLGPYRDRIALGVASALGLDATAVGVKAKTNEGLDAVGRGEAIAAHAVALLRSSGE